MKKERNEQDEHNEMRIHHIKKHRNGQNMCTDFVIL